MLEALERHFGASANWSRPEGGYFNWLDLPDGVDAGELLPRATEAGVAYCKGADFYPDGRGAARSGSPTAIPRPRRSSEESPSWPSWPRTK